jgi:hypothetical protein
MRSTSRHSVLAVSLLVALGVAGAPGIALADPSAGDMAQARALLNQGLELREKGDAAGALERLRGAHALASTPITGIELGRTYLALGKLVEARETFLSVARIPVRPEETARSRSARTESDTLAEQLRGRIPTLTVKVTGVPIETVSVTIDGGAVPSEALAAPRFVNPGSHAVAARSTLGGTADTTVTLKEKDARDVELKIVPPPTPPVGVSSGPVPGATPGQTSTSAALNSAPEAAPEGRSHALEWTLIGAGAAIGVAGGILMGVEVGKASDAIHQQSQTQYDSSKSLWTVGLVGTIVGGAALATGVIVFAATAGSKAPTTGSGHALWVGVGPERVTLGGTW